MMQALLPGRSRILDDHRLVLGSPVPVVQALLWLEQARRWTLRRPPPGARALSSGEVFLLESELGPVVIKRKLELGLKGVLAAAGLREPQLQRSFRLGREARAAGLQTPEPLLYAERQLGIGLETIVVIRFNAGVPPWSLLGHKRMLAPLLESLGRELARWHAAGLRHRDLKGPNLLYVPETSTSILLDLAGVHACSRMPGAHVRAQDLGRLRSGALAAGMTSRQWQHLLDAYCQQASLQGCDLRHDVAFHTAIDAFVQRKLQRYGKLNKPVY